MPNEDFLRLLTATALHPGLRSLLLFDANVEQVEHTARSLAELLALSTGKPAETVRLAWHHDEDAIWGNGSAGLDPNWLRPGILAPEDNSSWRLVVIPDLPHLSIPAQRACVQAIGTQILSLQRYGQNRSLRPNLCWLAACPRSSVGEVSPHLLDRWSLRWTFRAGSEPRHPPSLRNWLESRPESRKPILQPWKERLQAVNIPMPLLSRSALDRVALNMSAIHSPPGVRSHLTLARLAVALAWLQGEPEVEASRVDDAAELLKLEPAMDPTDPDETVESEPFQESVDDDLPKEDGPLNHDSPTLSDTDDTDRLGPVDDDMGTESTAAVESPRIEPLPESFGMSGPWPETEAETRHELGSLQSPVPRWGRKSEGHGIAIGVRPTSDLRKIALIPTLLAATPFQEIRRKDPSRQGHIDPGKSRRWLLEMSDLREWLRSPTAQEILVLLLDLTAYGSSDWPNALVPYIQRAYTDRAAVCVISVGAKDPQNELRAERITARNVLAPAFQEALDREPGHATPLADGLQLTLDTLRKTLQHGRSTVRKARLVVLTDGRGNVPLAAGRGEPLVSPVGRRGVEDALSIARELAEMRGVDIDLLDPQPYYGAHLTEALAKALAADVTKIPSSPEPGL